MEKSGLSLGDFMFLFIVFIFFVFTMDCILDKQNETNKLLKEIKISIEQK